MSDLAGRCGSCAAFMGAYEHAELGLVGRCGLEVYPPPVRATFTCTRYRPKGAGAPAPRPRAAGEPRGHRRGPAPARRSPPRGPTVVRRPLPQEIDIDMDIDEFRNVLRQVLSEQLGVSETPLGSRWEGGEVILKPGTDDTAEKRIPLDAFFHKIVMVRDKLRVLEAKVNSHKRLSDAEKVQLQQYITACYGSLTTFNVLFAEREDGFVGARTKDD